MYTYHICLLNKSQNRCTHTIYVFLTKAKRLLFSQVWVMLLYIASVVMVPLVCDIIGFDWRFAAYYRITQSFLQSQVSINQFRPKLCVRSFVFCVSARDINHAICVCEALYVSLDTKVLFHLSHVCLLC